MPMTWRTACAIAGLPMCALLQSVSLPVLAASGSPTTRNFEVEDLFRLQDVPSQDLWGGSYAFSRDGARFAFLLSRPRRLDPTQEPSALDGHGRSDVWVQAEPGAITRNITNGSSDHSGWWSPQWSPDGSALAMLSTRGGSVGLWIWRIGMPEPVRITSGVSLTAGNAVEDSQPFIWVGSQHILFEAHETAPISSALQRSANILAQGWENARVGKATSASVLSTTDVKQDWVPPASLHRVNVTDLTVRVVGADINASWRPSRDGRSIAWVRGQSDVPEVTRPNEVTEPELSIVYRDTGQKTVSLSDVPIATMDSIRWSPDGRTVAMLGRNASGAVHVTRVDGASAQAKTCVVPSLAVPMGLSLMEWSADDDVLLRTHRRDGDRAQPDREDWFAIDSMCHARPLTQSLKVAPIVLKPQTDDTHFFGVSDDSIWRVNARTGQVTAICCSPGRSVELSWPYGLGMADDAVPRMRRTYDEIVIRVTGEGPAELRVQSLRTQRVEQMNLPSPSAELVAYAPASHSAVFLDRRRDGLRLQRVHERGVDLLAAVNQHLGEIEPGQWRRIEYRQARGAPQAAWLLFPPRFDPARRYPLLTSVYPEYVAGTEPPSSDGVNSDSFLNLQIAAAHGFIVLFPSLPLGPIGEADDPLVNLAASVLPAVDRAIELGFVDPKRLFLIGHSFGGFAVNGLLTQTGRFTAAVSMSGMSDLVSAYGAFSGALRYGSSGHRDFLMPSLLEHGQQRMGGPPWLEVERYVRNSPIFEAEKVSTPLMLVHGDLDFVPISQSEEFFRALVRTGQRAEFVRYWGEGHILESPANIRDFWDRVFDWFERNGAGQATVEE